VGTGPRRLWRSVLVVSPGSGGGGVKYEYEVWYHHQKGSGWDRPLAVDAGTTRREADRVARTVARRPEVHAVRLMRRPMSEWEVIYTP
jgi:hypothetical protein